MLSFLVRRLWQLLPLIGGAVAVTFLAVRLAPGNPVTALLAQQAANPALTADTLARYGLDQPLWRQFLTYASGLLAGDFGTSFRFPGRPVTSLLLPGLAASLPLAVIASATALTGGIGLAASAILGRWPTAAAAPLLLMLSLPPMVLATVLMLLFGVHWHLLPVAGWGSPAQAVMPVLTLALPYGAVAARLADAGFRQVMADDFIRTARAKGLSEPQLWWRHTLPNTAGLLATLAALLFGACLSGAFVVESIFNIPGAGRLAVQSLLTRDYPVTVAVTLVFTLAYALANLAADLIAALIDPRIALEPPP